MIALSGDYGIDGALDMAAAPRTALLKVQRLRSFVVNHLLCSSSVHSIKQPTNPQPYRSVRPSERRKAYPCRRTLTISDWFVITNEDSLNSTPTITYRIARQPSFPSPFGNSCVSPFRHHHRSVSRYFQSQKGLQYRPAFHLGGKPSNLPLVSRASLFCGASLPPNPNPTLGWNNKCNIEAARGTARPFTRYVSLTRLFQLGCFQYQRGRILP